MFYTFPPKPLVLGHLCRNIYYEVPEEKQKASFQKKLECSLANSLGSIAGFFSNSMPDGFTSPFGKVTSALS